jgi:hypothetical protein
MLLPLSVLAFMLLLFWPYRHGIGNYWDWTVPYFNLNFWDAILGKLLIWQGITFGQSLPYNSGMYWQLVLSAIYSIRIPTEYLVYLGLSFFGFFTIWIVWKTCKPKKEKINFLYLLIAMASFLNPAIYYKLLAGHMNYYFSFLLFVVLIYYLLKKFKPTLKHYLVLAIILAFVGAQIQFFLFAILALLVYFIVYRERFRWKFAIWTAVIAFFINLPWMVNIFFGVNNVSQISGIAGSESFSAAMFTNPARIFAMVFAPATNIQYAFPKIAFGFFAVFSLVLVSSIIIFFAKRKYVGQRGKDAIFIIILWAIFVFLCTGLFNYLKIPYVQDLYPLLRESGHFAPLILLTGLLALAFIWDELRPAKLIKSLLIVYMALFIIINFYTFYRYLPKVNYALARESFSQTKTYLDDEVGAFNVAEYPFWNQYGFVGQEIDVVQEKQINQSGWDSFILYSGQDFLSNYHDGGKNINDSFQYAILKNNALEKLRSHNIKYLLDFSSIYKSNYGFYTSPDRYESNPSLLNNPNFVPSLLAENQQEINKVSENVYEIKNSLPRIYGDGVTFKRVNSTEYKIQIKNLKDSTPLYFLDNYNNGWKIYLSESKGSLCSNPTNFSAQKTSECQSKDQIDLTALGYLRSPSFANSTHKMISGYANSWNFSISELKNNPDYKKYATENSDGTIDLTLTLLFLPQVYYYVGMAVSLMAILAVVFMVVFLKPQD